MLSVSSDAVRGHPSNDVVRPLLLDNLDDVHLANTTPPQVTSLLPIWVIGMRMVQLYVRWSRLLLLRLVGAGVHVQHLAAT